MTLSCEKASVYLSGESVGKKQKTLRKKLSFTGKGVFTGKLSTVTLSPADADHGIIFKRTDLPFGPLVPAKLAFVKHSPHCTMLVNREASVQTVEHLLAALYIFEIDNLLIEISGPEVPILDGSAFSFVEALREAKESGDIVTKDLFKPIYTLSSPVYFSKQDVHMVALPATEYRVTYLLDYPHFNLIGSQYYSLAVNELNFTNEIASARTFCLFNDLAPLMEKGLLDGVGLENGLVFNEQGVMNPEGLRFPNEPVRHKILDLIGDLALISVNFHAHIIAVKSGHAANHIFGLELLNHIKRENSQ